MPKPQPGQSPLYAGTFDCAAKTVRHEVILVYEIMFLENIKTTIFIKKRVFLVYIKEWLHH
jgi:hypothetical protein